MNHLLDLDELLGKVRSSYSKEYLFEAITSYRAGAYRAAVATTWVAVCIDIIEKIRELSSDGDARASALETKLDALAPNNRKGMQDFENNILEYACNELQIISTLEFEFLGRIKRDRNICVHPTFQQDGRHFQITAETARSHVVNACNHLLIHAPVKGKVLIEKTLDKILEGSFPSDDEKAYRMLSSDNYLGRAHDSVFRNLCIVLLKQIFKADTKITVGQAEKVFASLNAIERLKNRIYRETIREKLNSLLANSDDRRLKRIFLYINRSPSVWSTLENAMQLRIVELTLTLTADDVIKFKLHASAAQVPDIQARLIERVQSFEPEEKMKVLAGTPSLEFKQLAIETFVGSASFGSAYDNGIKYLIPHAEHFDENDLRGIISGSLENRAWAGINQILNAGGIQEVFLQLYGITKEKITDHSAIWKSFWDALLERGLELDFEDLGAALLADGIIEPENEAEAESELEDEIPF